MCVCVFMRVCMCVYVHVSVSLFVWLFICVGVCECLCVCGGGVSACLPHLCVGVWVCLWSVFQISPNGSVEATEKSCLSKGAGNNQYLQFLFYLFFISSNLNKGITLKHTLATKQIDMGVFL